ncbi:MAG: hypothetical protein AABY22_04245 [Nanoarchaeota archaeon]
MKIKKLHIEQNSLYQLSTETTSSDVYLKIPNTYKKYDKKLNFDYDEIKIISSLLHGQTDSIQDYLRRLACMNKIVVLVKQIHWMNFVNTKHKEIYENSFIPIIEVLSIKDNMIFYVKPKHLLPLQDGQTHEEDFAIRDKKLKTRMLKMLEIKKNNRKL